jgi:hypothetical protein
MIATGATLGPRASAVAAVISVPAVPGGGVGARLWAARLGAAALRAGGGSVPRSDVELFDRPARIHRGCPLRAAATDAKRL